MTIAGVSVFGIALLLAFSAVLIWLGETHRSDNSLSGFTMGHKKIRNLKIIFGIFSVVGAGEFVYMSELSYSFGMSSIALFAGFAIGAIIFSKFFVEKLRKFHTAHNEDSNYDVVSIPDIAWISSGRKASVISAFYVLVTLGSLLMMQFVLGGIVVNILTGLPYAFAVLLLVSVVGTYVYRGGFGSILFTDIIQVVSLFVIFILIAFVVTTSSEPVQAALSITTIPDANTLLLLFIGGICWVLGGADIWQRLTAAQTNTIAKRGLNVNAVLLLVFGFILAYVGAHTVLNLPVGSLVDTGKGLLAITPVNSFEALLHSLPVFAKTIVVIGLFAGFISTADTEIHAISTILSKEYTRGRKNSTTHVRYFVVGVCIFTFLAAIILRSHVIDAYLILLNVFIVLGGFMVPALMGYGRSATSVIGLLLPLPIIALPYVAPGISDAIPGTVQVLAIFFVPMIFGFLGGKARLAERRSSI